MLQHDPHALLLEQIHSCSLACAARLAAVDPTNTTQALHCALLCQPYHQLQQAKNGTHITRHKPTPTFSHLGTASSAATGNEPG